MAPYGAKARFWAVKDVSEFVSTTGLRQYREAFEGNNIDGKRFMRLSSNQLPQMGIQRFDHIKVLWKRIKKIQEICLRYEKESTDPEMQIHNSAARIQSLARGKISRKKVEEIKKEKEEQNRVVYTDLARQAHEDQDELVRELADEEQRKIEAAMKIQQRARGMSDRKKVKELKEKGELPGQKRIMNQIDENEELAEPHPVKQHLVTPEQEEAARLIQKRAKGMNTRKKIAEQKAKGELPGQKPHHNTQKSELSKIPTINMTPEQEEAARKIQQRARGMNDRKKVKELKEKGELPGQKRMINQGEGQPQSQEGGTDADASMGADTSAHTAQQDAQQADGQNESSMEAGGEQMLTHQEGDDSSTANQSGGFQMTPEQEEAAKKIQQRARGMNDRKKVKELKEKGELPGQKRMTNQGEGGGEEEGPGDGQGGVGEAQGDQAIEEAHQEGDASSTANQSGGFQMTPEQEEAAKKIQQRARGMNDRKKVKELKEKGELPGQKRMTNQGEGGGEEEGQGEGQGEEEGGEVQEEQPQGVETEERNDAPAE